MGKGERREAKREETGAREEQQTEEKAPAVKYKNPDAWSRTMPESVYEKARSLRDQSRTYLQL